MTFQYLICVSFQTTSWDAYGTRKNDVEIIGMWNVLVQKLSWIWQIWMVTMFCDENLRIFASCFVGVSISFFIWIVFPAYIEFAALLLNTNSGLVESVFHHFVRPTHFPMLSDYCRSQTGLSQSFIDQQKSFSDVYNKFLNWLRQHIVKRNLVFATPQTCRHTPPTHAGLNATFCTWYDWDMGHYLYRDCIRNEISRYECMKSWIDIRRAFDVSVSFFHSVCVLTTKSCFARGVWV